MDQSNRQDNALFDALFSYALKENAIRETQAIPSNEVLKKEYQFSDEFENKMKNIIKKQRNKRVMKKVYYYGKKIAACIMIIITIGFGALMTVDAVQQAVINTIIEWYDDHNAYTFKNTSGRESDDILADSHAQIPDYIPEGFELTDSNVNTQNSIYFYSNVVGKTIVFRSSIITDEHTTFIDNEHTDYEEIEINGKNTYLFIGEDNNDNSVSLIWIDGNIIYSVDSWIGVSEAIKIAKSVK